MVVTRISRLRDCGVFCDFTWTTELPEFGRYNLIYGWNGTGKTTISRIFRNLEMRASPTVGQVTIRLGERDIGGGDFPQTTLPVRVFNRDFVAENVFPVGGGDLPPIFVLGKESVEKQKEIDRLKANLEKAQADLSSSRSKEQEAEKDLEKFCVDRARFIKDTLRSSGSNPYNNYNKTDFQRDAEEMKANGDAATHRLAEEDRDSLLTQHRATPKPKVQKVAYSLPNLESITSDVSELLSATVVSSAIQTLKNDPSLSQWTREGLKLHRERSAEQCFFCEQPLPSNRLSALEAHFSAQYEQFMQRVDQLITQIQSEPPRDSRRLHFLRGWSDEKHEAVFPGGPATGGTDGLRASGRVRLAVGGTGLDRLEDRVHAGNLAQLGAAG